MSDPVNSRAQEIVRFLGFPFRETSMQADGDEAAILFRAHNQHCFIIVFKPTSVHVALEGVTRLRARRQGLDCA